MSPDQYDTLRQRMTYLKLRAEIKDRIGWDSTYELREREALGAAIRLAELHYPLLAKAEPHRA